MASMVCSVVVLLAVFYLMPWLYYLPKTVLGDKKVRDKWSM